MRIRKYAAHFIALLLLATPLSAAVNVQGTVRFENRAYSQSGWGSNSYSPARYVTVQIVRASDSAVLQTFSTNASGVYSGSVSGLNAGDAYKIKVFADTAAVKVSLSVGNPWWCVTNNVTSTNIAFDMPMSGVCASVARSLNIVDAMVEGYQWAGTRAGGNPHQIDVLYPNSSVAQYDQNNNYILIPNDVVATNDDVLLHEYGHFLQDDFTATMIMPGGTHGYCGSAASNSLAFSEAWATFILLAVRGREWGVAYQDDTSTDLRFYEDFETATHYFNGSSVCVETGADNELAIGAVLSDTRDSADETWDVISSQQQKTWDIFDKTWQNRSSVPDVHQFRTDWGNETEMAPLFCKYISTTNCGPPAPTANAASNQTSSSFQANWGSASGASGYRLDVSLNNSFSSFVSGYNNLDVGNVLSKSVTGLAASTNYYYRVRSYNGSGTSGNSNTINTSTSGSTPSAPTANAASNHTSSSFQANWGSSAGANGYRLDVSPNSSFSSFISGYNNLDVGNTQSQTVSGLSAATTYFYRVRAYNGSGTSGNSNTIGTATNGGGNPAPTVSNVTPNSGSASGGTSVTITGTGFLAGATVTFGGSSASSVSVNNTTSITCTTPAHSAGAVTVIVTNTDAQSGQLSNGFTYTGSTTSAYDATLRAPLCSAPSSVCDSGSLLVGRSSVGPEPNAPNTLQDSCADGGAGGFHSDESLDRLIVSTVDGSVMAPGKQVWIDAWVWAYSEFASDHLDLYYASNASAPSWTYLTTLTPTVAGLQQLSTQYTIPSGSSVQAIRGVFRFNGSASSCGTNSGYDDYDDLAFAVSGQSGG
ncbi:MAG TPA: fibronectin type III domain-containing protein, partial [Thermoanaerobaculia bacterium]